MLKLGDLVSQANQKTGGSNKSERKVSLGVLPRNFGSSETMNKKAKRNWRMMQLLLILSFFLIILSFFYPLSNTTLSNQEHEVAEQYLISYLTGENLFLPVADSIREEWVNVLNSGVKNETPIVVHLSSNGNNHHFLVQEEGFINEFVISMVTVNGLSFMGTMPYIQPYAFLDESAIPEIFSNGTSTTSQIRNEELAQRIDRWGNAYFENNPSDLYELTGTASDVSFIGLQNTSYVRGSATILNIVGTLDETSTDSIAKVRFQISFASRPQSPITVDYDLLVNNLDTPRPNIIAWGPSGTGNELVPLENAIEPGFNYFPNTDGINSDIPSEELTEADSIGEETE